MLNELKDGETIVVTAIVKYEAEAERIATEALQKLDSVYKKYEPQDADGKIADAMTEAFYTALESELPQE